jgi:hypothetical protein
MGLAFNRDAKKKNSIFRNDMQPFNESEDLEKD